MGFSFSLIHSRCNSAVSWSFLREGWDHLQKILLTATCSYVSMAVWSGVFASSWNFTLIDQLHLCSVLMLHIHPKIKSKASFQVNAPLALWLCVHCTLCATVQAWIFRDPSVRLIILSRLLWCAAQRCSAPMQWIADALIAIICTSFALIWTAPLVSHLLPWFHSFMPRRFLEPIFW